MKTHFWRNNNIHIKFLQIINALKFIISYTFYILLSSLYYPSMVGASHVLCIFSWLVTLIFSLAANIMHCEVLRLYAILRFLLLCSRIFWTLCFNQKNLFAQAVCPFCSNDYSVKSVNYVSCQSQRHAESFSEIILKKNWGCTFELLTFDLEGILLYSDTFAIQSNKQKNLGMKRRN